MERLISLFREPDYEQWSPSDPQPPPQRAQDEPLYFQQLLEYLRKRRSGECVEWVDDCFGDAGEVGEIEIDADTLIGAGA